MVVNNKSSHTHNTIQIKNRRITLKSRQKGKKRKAEHNRGEKQGRRRG